MRKSKTRRKLFFTCILFMCTFMVLFVVALQVVTDSAYFEACAEAEIIKMQQLNDVYSDYKCYFEEILSLFSSAEYINEDVIDILKKADDSHDENIQLSVEELSKESLNYILRMDIFLVDKNSIVRLYTEDEEPFAEIKEHQEGNVPRFIVDEDIFEFLASNGMYEENNLYRNSHVIVEELFYGEDDYYIIGIPRYDKIFDFTSDKIVIYDKYDNELLRLNTESIEKEVPTSNISRGKNYKVFGIAQNRNVLCYYSDSDEQGDYCLGMIDDFDFGFRNYIYIFLLLFFIVVSIGLWHRSKKITKPLDFFMMWIKLVKDKDSLKGYENAEMPMQKENYFLQNNIMLFFSLCLLPIIFAGCLNWYSENLILNKFLEQNYVESAEFYGHILDEKYYLWRKPIAVLCSDERIKDSLKEYQEKDDIDFDKEFIQYLQEYAKVICDESDGTTIYNAAGNVVVSSVGKYEDDRYIKYRVNVNEDYKWSFAEGLSNFVLHQKIYDENGEIIGYCKLEFNDTDLNTNISYKRDYLYSCYIYKYTDKIFNLQGSPDITDEEVVNMITNSEEYSLAKTVVLEKANVNYFYKVSDKIFFYKIWDKYIISFLNIIFFLSIALITAAGILTRTTLNPIISISNSLYNDSPQIPTSTLLLGKEEFALIVNRVRALSEQVNAYAEEQKHLEAEKIENEKKRKDAEILTLQTQINPHFMYNIFSSIGVLIRTNQTEKATKMVMHTGNLMRLGLYRGHVMVPLKEEIDHVVQYLNIQQIRYNNCMEFDINIDETLMQWKVVKFILQPIVENAIEHNVGYLEDKALKIDIEATAKNNQLVIRIADNGRGMNDEEMGKLQQSINNFDMSSHLGLANINERIKLNCGREYGVTLSRNNNGLKVILILPIVIEKE